MNDRLLKELGDLARQQDEAERARFDERWDRLAAGTLTAEEEAELKALAEASPEDREAYEAFRPLGADFQARSGVARSAELASDCAAARLRSRVPASSLSAAPSAGSRSGWGPRRRWRRECSSFSCGRRLCRRCPAMRSTLVSHRNIGRQPGPANGHPRLAGHAHGAPRTRP